MTLVSQTYRFSRLIEDIFQDLGRKTTLLRPLADLCRNLLDRLPRTRYLSQMQINQQVQLLPLGLGRSPVGSSHVRIDQTL